ncbi:hypothetical protein VTK73DRAFT_6563 [Phialemonium thermophilum]|uniref:Uncharacterized protein n=1 Tax=Phialemonium thermophilum TaxID=223376 RepID=A0ABR3WJ00_9PEZI
MCHAAFRQMPTGPCPVLSPRAHCLGRLRLVFSHSYTAIPGKKCPQTVRPVLEPVLNEGTWEEAFYLVYTTGGAARPQPALLAVLNLRLLRSTPRCDSFGPPALANFQVCSSSISLGSNFIPCNPPPTLLLYVPVTQSAENSRHRRPERVRFVGLGGRQNCGKHRLSSAFSCSLRIISWS